MSEDKTISILYVDDEEINLFLFRSLFENEYEVITARSGTSGLQELEKRNGQVTVVISDMNMPEINGVEFVSQAYSKYNDIIYFILTGYNYSDQIDQAIKRGIVRRYFSKPYDPDQLSQAIKEIV